MFYHKAFFFWGYGVFIDFALILVRNYRLNKFSTLIHGCIMCTLGLGTISFFIATLILNKKYIFVSMPFYMEIHLVNSFIITILVILNQLFGYVIKVYYLENKKINYEHLFKYKQIHKIVGNIIYFIVKIQIILGIYWSKDAGSSYFSKIWVGYLLVIASTIFRGLFYFMHKKQQKFYKKTLMIFKHNKKLINDKNYKKLLSLIREGTPKHQIMNIFPHIKYCIYKNSLIALKDFSHPGGSYIIQQINGREIDCFIFGGYQLEHLSIPPHLHSNFAEQYFIYNQIGSVESITDQYNIIQYVSEQNSHSNIQISPLKKQKISAKSSSINSIENLDCQNLDQQISIPLVQQSKLQVREIYEAKIASFSQISPQANKYLFQLSTEFNNTQYKIKNIQYGVEWIGKHYILNIKGHYKKRLYTNVICMTKENIQYRAKLFDITYSNFEKDISLSQNYTKYSDYLPLMIKNYEKKSALSTKITQVCYETTQFQIQGPHGLGLQLKNNSKGQYVIFAGGTGIFPFLDLLDFLLRKSIYMIAEKQKGKQWAQKFIDPFNQGLGEVLNDFKLTLFVSFNDSNEFFGRDIIEPLALLNRKYSLNLVNVCLRFSNKPKILGIKVVQETIMSKYIQKFDQRFIQKELDDIDLEEIEKVWVCGPPQMQQTVPQFLSQILDQNKIYYI